MPLEIKRTLRKSPHEFARGLARAKCDSYYLDFFHFEWPATHTPLALDSGYARSDCRSRTRTAVTSSHRGNRGQHELGSELSADCLSAEQATHSRFHARRSITESRPVLRASSECILAHHGCIVRCRSVVALSGKGSDPSVNRRRALGFASGVHKVRQLGRVDQRRGGQRLSGPLRQVSEHYSCVL